MSLSFLPRVIVALLFSAAALAADSGRIRIVLVGDSTVTDSAGWGLGFAQFIDPARVEVINTSQGGRSSMSFIKEGRWERALALKGDYYLIQFGHNDEPGKPGRSTTLDEYRGYMNQYVDEARAAGAVPVLVTSLVRRQFDKADDHKINSSLEGHVAIVKEIAAAKKVPLVDLHARSKALCEKLGREGCLAFSPLKTADGKTVPDGTHLNREGYVMFGRLVVEELRAAVPKLASELKSAPRNPLPQPGEAKSDAVVSADGSGTHTTVQAAIAVAPENGTKPFVILIKPGTYQGQILVPATKRHIRLVGEEVNATVLTYGLNVNEVTPETIPNYKGIGVIVLGDDFSADKITFQNTSGDHGQALALRIDGDRATVTRCRLLGWQDTLRVEKGRQYFKDCYIEGRVDFIYGSGTAVFDHCQIHSKNGGYVTAASTPTDHPFGLVFLHCRLTGDPTPWDAAKASDRKPLAYLGRPWRPYAQVAFIGCELGDHIRAEGWHNWGKAENEKTARYVEFGNTGPGAATEGRVKWARQLTAEEAKAYDAAPVLAGSDGWNPTKGSTTP